MPVTINLVLIVELIIAAFVGLGVKALFQLSRRIDLMNGRIGRLEMWTEQHGHGRHDFGFVAEEVEEVNPLLVTYRPELTGVKYGKLTALLVKAVQELEARVAALE